MYLNVYHAVHVPNSTPRIVHSHIDVQMYIWAMDAAARRGKEVRGAHVPKPSKARSHDVILRLVE
jgi:hypothetical protein